MRLVRFEAENFGPHAHLGVDFRPGLNVVVGRNGSGKSHLVDGVYAALTGEFPGEGNQQANVRQTAPKGARCQVTADLRHAGAEVRIVRRVAPSPGRELTVNGERVGRTADEVNDALWGRLGVTLAVLTDYAFVRQWEAFGVLTDTPAKRLKALNRLFGVDQVDRAYAALDARVSALTGPVSVPPERLHEAERRAAQASARLLQTESRLAGLWDDARCAELIAGHTARTSARDDRRQKETRLAALLDQATRAEEERRRLTEDAERLTVEYEHQAHVYNGLLAVRQSVDADARLWADHDRQAAEFDRQRSHREQLAAQADRAAAALAAADAVADEVRQAARALRDEARARHADALRVVREHCAAGGDTCPTCRSPITPEYRRWYAEQQAALPALEARAVETSREVDRLDEIAVRRLDLQGRHERAAAALSALPAFAPPKPPDRPRPTPEHVQEATRAANEAWSALSRMKTDKDRACGQRDRAAREAEAAAVAVAQLNGQIEALPPLPPEVSDADYQTAVAHRAERSSLQVALAACRAELAAADAERRSLERLVGEGRRRADAAARLKPLKDVFRPGPGGLAAQVVDYCLESIAGVINARLEQFAAPFAVRVDAQAALTALFPDGTRTPVNRLSGGQKMVLALAFRLSVLSEYGGDLGFLCLDEPTVGMDDANRAGLTRCLAEVGRWAAAGDSQLIIVTHDAHLAAAADHVVRLG